ncbi:MAG TPA: hypothetical protein VHQ93_00070, partial [Chitinophagaceae bacterium]|nr:hypothetical protein [Chitinophagaceae bacterium]
MPIETEKPKETYFCCEAKQSPQPFIINYEASTCAKPIVFSASGGLLCFIKTIQHIDSFLFPPVYSHSA